MDKNKDKKPIELIPFSFEAGSKAAAGLQCDVETGVCGVSAPASEQEAKDQAEEKQA